MSTEQLFYSTGLEVFKYAITFALLYQTSRYLISPHLLGKYSKIYHTLQFGEQTYWDSSIVSTIHAIIVSYLALTAAYNGSFWSSWPHFELTLTSPESHLALQVMTGYMISDGLTIFYYRKEKAWQSMKTATLIHHSVVTLIHFMIMTLDFGHTFALIGTITEITTPLINNRWFLYTSKEADSNLYFYNGISLVFMWFVVRIVIAGPGSLIPLYMNEESLEWYHKLVFWTTYGLMYPLQWMWFIKLVKGALKALDKDPKKKD